MATVNMGIAAALFVILPMRPSQLYIGLALLSLMVLTLLVTLYDRYRPIYLARKHRTHVAHD
jgi:hypothetical protein